MKILHVITSLKIGGAEKLMVGLLPRLRNYGHIVDLLVFDGTRTSLYEELEEAGIKIYHLSIGKSVYNPINIIKSVLITVANIQDNITHNTPNKLILGKLPKNTYPITIPIIVCIINLIVHNPK